MLTNKSALPIVRWAGSKKRILPEILRAVPKFSGKYVEPFAGSACLFFRLNPDRASLNDLNQRLTDFYRTASIMPDEVYEKFVSIERSRERYYEVRAQQNLPNDPVLAAAHFLFLNRNCFNGIYRVNKSGAFNVPFSNSRVAPYPSLEEFLDASKLLRRAEISSADFETFCERVCGEDDFVYLDPPYYVPEVRIFREYNETDFTENDTQRLVALLDRMAERGVKFLLSYPKGALAAELAARWSSREFKAMRSIAGNSSARRAEIEVLIANYDLD